MESLIKIYEAGCIKVSTMFTVISLADILLFIVITLCLSYIDKLVTDTIELLRYISKRILWDKLT